jgi:hypothetical protein
MIHSILKIVFISLIVAITSTSLAGQSPTTVYVPADKALYDTIHSQDSILFAAFNARNLEKMKTFFATDLEVYQDNIGVRSYEQTIDAFAGLFTRDYILTRHLVKESLEVYPVKDYGAIETGSHTFCHTENGELVCGTFKFVHIWEHQNGQWKITRIITYDHKL